MAKKSKPPSPFEGRWRIVSMSAWDEDYIDEEEEGFFEFDEKGGGEFHFGYVHGHMDCKPTTRAGESAVEWTWLKGNELHGMVFFHGGDDSEFVAKKKGQSRKKPTKKPTDTMSSGEQGCDHNH